ncbi:HEAT repeat domain-containing protein [Murimonas intestini]|nr:HEAT repeat domain-containing protein [Murimonas intestini]
MQRIAQGENIEQEHLKLAEKKLVKTEALFSFGAALDALEEKSPGQTDAYMYSIQGGIQVLASRYAKKDSMDRAYFAFLISRHCPGSTEEFKPVMEILISFLDDSTVYCKENVLKALYSLGNVQAVENALQVFNDRGWFHHQKLLSDGLLTFRGDLEKLAERLWSHHREWNDRIMLSVIQFITGFSENYKEIFLPFLEQETAGREIRLAIMRYYRRHTYEPARPLLISLLLDEKGEDNAKIVAASVLSQYPGEDTAAALKKALQYYNWYVRYNAASSLAAQRIPARELLDVLEGKDRYAKEILEYMLEDAKAGEYE